eukprot:TRINITY_DN29658_c0_g1_i1.p1 TRINITY_DN29658_c0_g1~~TRINITY_DN29658_c0_g1_i1.p1  ORF type:complete len:366 (+),score=141.91 TRINITY_DN29658_c0_g1_i1:64-1098(+)
MSTIAEQYGYVLFLVAGYSLSAGLLVIINKWALSVYPYGANLTALQFAVSAFVAFMIGILKIDDVDPLDFGKVKAFLPAVVMFYISVAANLKLLQNANVDTYIVVRACVPLLTCALDVLVMKAKMPANQTLASMVMIVLSAAGYIATDEGFVYAAYLWAALYMVAMSIDTILIKKVVEDVKLTRWGMVYYNNLLAVCFFPIGSMSTGELGTTTSSEGEVTTWMDHPAIGSLTSPAVLGPVALSCAVGVAISFFGLNTRKALTSTSFTVLGVVNKFFTVLVNTMAWDKHASPVGIFFVIMTIVGGVWYQQSMGSASITKRPAEKVPEADVEQQRSQTPQPDLGKR